MEPRLFIFVFIGGGLGSIIRFAIGLGMWKIWPGFPAGTLAVNLIGTFLIGIVSILAAEKELIHPPFRELIQVGFLGGLTTFSSFGFETVALYNQNRYAEMIFYFLGNLILGISLVVLGRYIARGI